MKAQVGAFNLENALLIVKFSRTFIRSSTRWGGGQHADTCPVKLKQLELGSCAPALPPLPPSTLYGWRPSDLERWARIVFPVFFLSFHLLYWTILVNISEHTVEGLMPLKAKSS